jgi:hypothetical protein
MEAWDGSVALGKIVCAVSEYAPLLINSIKFGIGVSSIASGRSPSMLMMITRFFGVGVGVIVCVIVGTRVCVGVGVIVAVGVAVANNAMGDWHAHRQARIKIFKMFLFLFFISCILTDIVGSKRGAFRALQLNRIHWNIVMIHRLRLNTSSTCGAVFGSEDANSLNFQSEANCVSAASGTCGKFGWRAIANSSWYSASSSEAS